MLFRMETLLTSPVITGGEPIGTATNNVVADSAVQTPVDGGAVAVAPMAEGDILGMPWEWAIFFYVLVIFGAYWFLIRPQRKREKEMLTMQKSIGNGDNVLTSSGMYGQVVSVGEDVFVIEFGTNRGVRIPVRKSDIVGIRTPKLTPAPVVEAPEPPAKPKLFGKK